MTLTAVDLDSQGKALKWKVENSWGDDNGHKGYLIMSNNWFNDFFFRLVVDKQYVSADILKDGHTNANHAVVRRPCVCG